MSAQRTCIGGTRGTFRVPTRSTPWNTGNNPRYPTVTVPRPVATIGLEHETDAPTNATRRPLTSTVAKPRETTAAWGACNGHPWGCKTSFSRATGTFSTSTSGLAEANGRGAHASCPLHTSALLDTRGMAMMKAGLMPARYRAGTRLDCRTTTANNDREGLA